MPARTESRATCTADAFAAEHDHLRHGGVGDRGEPLAEAPACVIHHSVAGGGGERPVALDA